MIESKKDEVMEKLEKFKSKEKDLLTIKENIQKIKLGTLLRTHSGVRFEGQPGNG